MTAEEQQATVEHLQQIRKEAATALGQLGVTVLDGATEEGILRNDLTQMVQIVQETSILLGYQGAARGLPEFTRGFVAGVTTRRL